METCGLALEDISVWKLWEYCFHRQQELNIDPLESHNLFSGCRLLKIICHSIPIASVFLMQVESS